MCIAVKDAMDGPLCAVPAEPSDTLDHNKSRKLYHHPWISKILGHLDVRPMIFRSLHESPPSLKIFGDPLISLDLGGY